MLRFSADQADHSDLEHIFLCMDKQDGLARTIGNSDVGICCLQEACIQYPTKWQSYYQSVRILLTTHAVLEELLFECALG